MKLPKELIEKSIHTMLADPAMELLQRQEAAKSFMEEQDYTVKEAEEVIGQVLDSCADAHTAIKSKPDWQPPKVHVDVVNLRGEEFMRAVREFAGGLK